VSLKVSAYFLGNLLKYLGLVMLVPGICSVIYQEDDLYVFLISGVITSVSGLIMEFSVKSWSDIREVDRKTGFMIVALTWIFASIYGALPYLLYGVFTNPADAFFESVSGFTTTGASVMTDVEIFPHGIMFWRSLTHWLGGMGIIVLAIAVLPRLAVGGMQLMGLESSGPTTEKLTPKIAETAKKLWGVYLLLTVLLIILLDIAGVPIYDAIIHAFGTIATGGFSNHNLSIGYYNSPYVEGIITLFMFLSGINFTLHYFMLRGKISNVYRNSELRFYIIVNVVLISVITLDLWNNIYPTIGESLRFSSFQLLTAYTTAGFSSVDFDTWPTLSKFILVIVMLMGSCAGSTSGAIKSIRILVLIKRGYREILKLIHPKRVIHLRLDGQVIDESAASSISSFVFLYLALFALSSCIVLGVEHVSIVTAISACAATFGGVGPGLEQVGPMQNYAFLTSFTKVYLSFLMILGRLELYAILVLITPSFWRK